MVATGYARVVRSYQISTAYHSALLYVSRKRMSERLYCSSTFRNSKQPILIIVSVVMGVIIDKLSNFFGSYKGRFLFVCEYSISHYGAVIPDIMLWGGQNEPCSLFFCSLVM